MNSLALWLALAGCAVLLPVAFTSCENSNILDRSFGSRNGQAEVRGQLSITPSCKVVIRNFRYSASEPSQWWSVSASSNDQLLSELEWDASMDGIAELSMELNREFAAVEALELRIKGSGEVVARVELTEKPMAAQRKLLQAPACLLRCTFNATRYCKCAKLTTAANGPSFMVYWTQLNSSGISFAMQGPADDTIQWMGLGFPETPGEMIGAHAIIAKTNETSTTGSSVGQYFLAAKSPSGIRPSRDLAVTGLTAEVKKGVLMAKFVLKSNTVLSLEDGTAAPIIWAQGPLGVDGNIAYHSDRGASEVEVTAAPSSTSFSKGP